jgi:uncharacterized membrane protein
MKKTILRNKNQDKDPVWHVQLTMLVAIALQLSLADRYVLGSRYGLVIIEGLLLLAMTFTTPRDRIFRSLTRRINVFALIVITALANIYSLVIVAGQLIDKGHIANGRILIFTAINIYITNIIVFGLFYWEMDAGGPGQRMKAESYEYDFLFPQSQNPAYKHPRWRPTFIDYLYVSSTNAMAFSPTDTMPMSRRAKLLMLGQAVISLVAIALVAARAVNILT